MRSRDVYLKYARLHVKHDSLRNVVLNFCQFIQVTAEEITRKEKTRLKCDPLAFIIFFVKLVYITYIYIYIYTLYVESL